MEPTPEPMVSDIVRNLLRPYPPATLTLKRPHVRLARPAVSHADWQGLPAFALATLFRHLPVPDLLRLGYLFTPRWREVWRMHPLDLHDRHFASLPITRSEVPDAIANVLEEFVHGIEDEDEDVEEQENAEDFVPRCMGVRSFRVESTRWRPDHAARWCAALERGKVIEVVLVNRGVPGQLPVLIRVQPPVPIRVPPGLLRCTTVRDLHLAFFTVEAGELDALTETMGLGLYGCACRPGVIEAVVTACPHLNMLWVHDSTSTLDSVVVRSALNLYRLSMLRSVSRSLTVEDAPILHELLPGSTAALSISGAPELSTLMRLNLPETTLEIDGAEIAVDRQAMEPQMPSVGRLWLALDYTALRGMVPHVVQQMLMRFPGVHHLTIERKDAVPQEEGMASQSHSQHDEQPCYVTLYGGLDQRLRILTLIDFRGGKAELELAMAIMHSTHALRTVNLAYGYRRLTPELRSATAEARAALERFTILSNNPSLRNHWFDVRDLCTRDLGVLHRWCGADLF